LWQLSGLTNDTVVDGLNRNIMQEESSHRNLHPELHPLLLRFHEMSGESLRSVWRVYDESNLDKIVLGFDQNTLIVEANADDDTIVFHVVRNIDLNTEGWVDAGHSEPWRRFIGEVFGWGWITINQQDALDGILLSFNGITPQVMLSVMASSIKESLIIEPHP
jgi:hypothetical protein